MDWWTTVILYDATRNEDHREYHDLSPTATARWGTGGNNVPFLVDAGTARRLSPEEVELLQGFPVGWTAPAAVATRYKQLGNAVTVNVIGWIAGRLDA
jgi:DNA (cytosine-5)-methyltransferase 1